MDTDNLITGSLEQLLSDIAILAAVTMIISTISAYLYAKVVV